MCERRRQSASRCVMAKTGRGAVCSGAMRRMQQGQCHELSGACNGDAPATRRPHAPSVAGSSGANSVVFPYCCRMSMTQAFNIALILVGDELLSGRRRDAHLPHFAGVFAARGLNLRQVWVVGDGREDICLLHTSDAADDPLLGTLGGRRVW